MLDKILERFNEEWNNNIVHDDDMYYIGKANAYADAIEIVKEAAKEYDGGWIPLEKGVLPDECEEVDVTIEDDDGDVYTSTSWLLNGVPVKPEDTVYIIVKKDISTQKVIEIHISCNGIEIMTNRRVFHIREIGKTVFLTRSEAEEALAKMEVRHERNFIQGKAN